MAGCGTRQGWAGFSDASREADMNVTVMGGVREFPWNVLVVDDEPDIHAVTRLVLGGMRWRGRKIAILEAHSASDAKRILASERIDIAIIDVVMESDSAGLELCRYIRQEEGFRALRTILRTGQPGHAPEEQVLTDFDIDMYLSKGDLTPERLRGAVGSVLRISHEVGTFEALAHHQRRLSDAVSGGATERHLLTIMMDALRLLSDRYAAKAILCPDSSVPESFAFCTQDETRGLSKIIIDRLSATTNAGCMMQIEGGGARSVLTPQVRRRWWQLSFQRESDRDVSPRRPVPRSSVLFLEPADPAAALRLSVDRDSVLFLGAWNSAVSTVSRERELARLRLELERQANSAGSNIGRARPL